MKTLILLIVCLVTCNAQVEAYREELGLLRHEERANKQGLDSVKFTKLVELKTPLDDDERDQINKILMSGKSIEIEWLICESSAALDLFLDLKSYTPSQFEALCNAFIDSCPVKGVPGGAEESITWGLSAKKLANRIANTVGIQAPSIYPTWTREKGKSWLKRALTDLEKKLPENNNLAVIIAPLIQQIDAD